MSNKVHSEDLFWLYGIVLCVIFCSFNEYVNAIYLFFCSIVEHVIFFIPPLSDSIYHHTYGFDKSSYSVPLILAAVCAFILVIKSRRIVY